MDGPFQIIINLVISNFFYVMNTRVLFEKKLLPKWSLAKTLML